MVDVNDPTGDVEGAFEGQEVPGPEEASPPKGEGLKDMALSTRPNKPLSEVESIWNPEEGGTTRLVRAAQKAFNADGIPAILDGLIAVPEIYVKHIAGGQNGGDAAGDELQGFTADEQL